MQFRFRTLLITIAVIGVMIAGYLHYSRRFAVLELVRSHRGIIYIHGDKSPYREDDSWRAIFWPVTRIRISSDLSEEETLRVLLELNEVRSIHFYGNAVSSRIASEIGKLPNLEEFESGRDTGVQGPDLEAICQAPSLRSVYLSDHLERSHFKVLNQSSSLTKIHAQGMYFTRGNLLDLIARPQLEELSFAFSPSMLPRKSIEELLQRHPKLTLACRGEDPRGEAWWNELKKRFPEAQIFR